TQRPLFALFRNPAAIGSSVIMGFGDLIDGLNTGARNMISIGVATATAGIIVGTVTLTGMGLMMTDLVEFVSGGNVIAMLFLPAFVWLLRHTGVPPRPIFVVVATLVVPVRDELGAEGAAAIPVGVVHLSVVYSDMMAPVTQLVGLA